MAVTDRGGPISRSAYFADSGGLRSLRDYAVACEPELQSPCAHAVADRVLRGLFLLLDLRPEYVPDRGDLRHLVWARDASPHRIRLSRF